MSQSFEVCSECGLIHPPILDGTPCPNAPIKTVDNKEIDLTKMLINLKNIFNSQIQIKKIKDPEKLFKLIIIEITKFLENYKEV